MIILQIKSEKDYHNKSVTKIENHVSQAKQKCYSKIKNHGIIISQDLNKIPKYCLGNQIKNSEENLKLQMKYIIMFQTVITLSKMI